MLVMSMCFRHVCHLFFLGLLKVNLEMLVEIPVSCKNPLPALAVSVVKQASVTNILCNRMKFSLLICCSLNSVLCQTILLFALLNLYINHGLVFK